MKNAEEEGLGCAQKFLNDPDVVAITYGAVAVGANTIASTVNGKKPIIMGFSLNPSDANADNTTSSSRPATSPSTAGRRSAVTS